MKKLAKQFVFTAAWLLLIYTGFELGVWQLNKAQNLSASTAPVADQPVIELSKVSSAGLNIPLKAVNRIVSASGEYSNKYIARDQKLVDEKIVDLDVRLLDLDTGHSVLIVRGLANEPLTEISSNVEVVGRLYPRQNVDRAFPKPGELSRIDPALVVSEQTPFLYDGYIVLKSEKLSPQIDTQFSPIPSPQISQRITTFYWQHISYVVVWWFMGVLLLIAPIFPQFRVNAEKVGASSDKKVGKRRKAGVKR